MITPYRLGFVCGIAISVLCTLFLIKWAKKGSLGKCRYDERQKLIRGEGYKYGFFTVLICDLLYSLFYEEIQTFLKTEHIMFLTILIGIAVYASYCIWNDGYYAMNENPRRIMVVFAVIGSMNILLFIRNAIINRKNLLDGGFINLCCGIVSFLLIFVTFLKSFHSQKENGE